MVVRRRVLVSGRVQGVWFRETCRQEAGALGLTGWVRNRADGRVEIEAEGEEASVDRLVAWARTGPRRARVEMVESSSLAPTGDRGFDVR